MNIRNAYLLALRMFFFRKVSPNSQTVTVEEADFPAFPSVLPSPFSDFIGKCIG